MDELDELASRLPLPMGVSIARYAHGMRELATYDIVRDLYLVRHDWLQHGQQQTLVGEPITYPHNRTPEDVEAELLKRRATALEAKNLGRA